LKKWVASKIGYLVLADIAEQSVKDAQNRYKDEKENLQKRKRTIFPAAFVVADCFSKENGGFLERLAKEMLFDVVSCQFSFHYAFETEARAKAAFYNVSSRLKPGGFFIGTIPHALRIVKNVRNRNALSFGNGSYLIEFEQKEHLPDFGATYYFTLCSAVERCPEWLVHPDVLKELGREFHLELLFLKDFHQFYYENESEHRNLLKTMDVFNDGGTLSEDEWEAAGLYQVFAFQKVGKWFPSKSFPPPPSDIIKTF